MIFSCCSCSYFGEEDNSQSISVIKEKIKSGDLLFRQGRSLESHVVLLADLNGDYSHVGMAVDVNGEIMVAHAVPTDDEIEYLQLDEIDDFFNYEKAEHGAICRFKMTDEQRQIINKKALGFVNDKMEFDGEYNTEDQSKLYCSEYVWEVYKEIGWDISRGKRSKIEMLLTRTIVIMPSHFYNNPNCELIYEY